MELVEHHDVAYAAARTPDAAQTFDAYIPGRPLDPRALVCFVHGGAWRTEDKADHVGLARSLAIATECAVAVPNYRLTPRQPMAHSALHHPAHAMDVLRFLEFVLSWHEENGGHLPQRPTKLFLIGHSCSAHMLSTVFLRIPGGSDGVCPSDQLVRSTAAVIMSEGIYDIDLLLSSFPQYRAWFIEDAFGRRDTFENVSAFKAVINPGSQHIRWFIIHSKGDTLIDERQSEGMYSFLSEKSCLVSKSFGELADEHDDILTNPKYVDIIERFIKQANSA